MRTFKTLIQIIILLMECLVIGGCGWERNESATPTVQWYALGDSITQGYYSRIDENGEAELGLDPKKCWAQIIADKRGWELTNLGVGGSGYVHPGTVLDKLDARAHVDSIDFSKANLVTLAFGVNDWKYDMPLGSMEDDVATGGTIYSNMRYCIEKIKTDAPMAKIVVISPINCCRYGICETDWGMGYAFDNNGTLEDIFKAQKEVCTYYDIEFIDMLHSSEVNGANAPQLLPDGVHPSLETHRLLAEELEARLPIQ